MRPAKICSALAISDSSDRFWSAFYKWIGFKDFIYKVHILFWADSHLRAQNYIFAIFESTCPAQKKNSKCLIGEWEFLFKTIEVCCLPLEWRHTWSRQRSRRSPFRKCRKEGAASSRRDRVRPARDEEDSTAFRGFPKHTNIRLV